MDEYEQEREEEQERRIRADELMEGLPQTRAGMGRAGRAYPIDPRKQEQDIAHAIGAMLNANVVLNSVSDCAGTPNRLAREARLAAISLTEAIALLRGNQS